MVSRPRLTMNFATGSTAYLTGIYFPADNANGAEKNRYSIWVMV